MLRLFRKTAAAATALMALASFGASADDTGTERVAIDWPRDSISVFSRTGNRLFVVGGEGSEYVYKSPSLHPDGDRVACIRCKDSVSSARVRQLLDCSVIEWHLDETGTSPLYKSSIPVAAPVYSPDGGRLALIRGTDVVVLDLSDRSIATTIAEVLAWTSREDLGVAQALLVGDWNTDLAWSDDGKEIFVSGPRWTPSGRFEDGLPREASIVEGVGTITLETGEISWMNLLRPMFVNGYDYSGSYAMINDGVWTWQHGPLPTSPATKALFGSAEHPVQKPKRPTGSGAYYFIALEQGWFSSTKLMRYDPSTRSLKRVHTFDRGIYRK